MKKRKDRELEKILEGLVDHHGIDAVIGMLGGVCEGKDTHLIPIWRDLEEGSRWEEKAIRLWNM